MRLADAAVNGPTADYWVAAATVLPVLALGVMAEARGTVRVWREAAKAGAKIPNWGKIFVSFLWIVYVVSTLFLVPDCLLALRSTHVGKWIPRAVETNVQLGISIVIISPLITLVSQSEWSVRLGIMLGAPWSNYRKWSASRSMDSFQDEVGREFHKSIAHHLQLLIQESEFNRNLAKIEAYEGDFTDFISRADYEKLVRGRQEFAEGIKASLAWIELTKAASERVRKFKENGEVFSSSAYRLKRVLEVMGEDLW